MRVIELASDLKVEASSLVQLLRGMGIKVAGPGSQLSEADAARVLARVERERRLGHAETSEAVGAAIEEAEAGPRRRRRRRRTSEPEPEAEVAAEESVEEAVAEAEVEEEVDSDIEIDELVAESSEEATDQTDDADAEIETEAEPDEEADTPVAEEEVVDEVTAEEEAEEEPEESADLGVEEGAEADAIEAVEVPEDELPAAPATPPTPARAGDAPKRTIRRPTPAASAGPGGQVRIQAEGYTTDGRRQRKDKKGKKRQRVDQGAVQENIQRVMAEIKGGGKKKRRGRARPSKEEIELAEIEAEVEAEREAKTVRVAEFLSVSELAELIDESPTAIIGSAFKNLGLMVTINQRLDFDQIEMLLEEFGFVAEREEEVAQAVEEVEEDRPEDLEPRPPVVTVMGHVDHGKTLLLDRIRNTNVVAGESGGITQHIGAYHVGLEDGRTITFLDTPGHAAFTAMRARGADITDIVVLMVAADDSVMPQTIEAISHAKNAGVPLVVAVNKIDLPAADPMRVKQELLQHGVTIEEFGGDVQVAEVSAKTGQGVEDLLDKVLLAAELLELGANPNREAQGTVIEAELDTGKGPVVSVLVQRGTLRVGDSFVCGLFDGRVRAMLDERGQNIEEVPPGLPVQILGSGGVPQAGDSFAVMDADEATQISSTRQRLEREKQLRVKERGLKLGDFRQLMDGETGTLPLIIKSDVAGSSQALSDALEQLSTSEVAVDVIHRGVGAINESDILLAQTAGAVVIGFRVRPDAKSRQMAEREGVDLHTYDVIYDAVDDIRAALEGMLAPEQRETILGSAEVRETFRIKKLGTIAGCYVVGGVIDRKARARLVRDGLIVYEGAISSLKRFKDDVKEVREGFECGIGIENFNDVKVGDVIEAYQVEEIARTLDSVAAEEG